MARCCALCFGIALFFLQVCLVSSQTVLWNTFVGNTTNDMATAVTVDDLGYQYVVGESDDSWGSPVSAKPDSNKRCWVAKWSPSGVRLWNTFLFATECRSIDYYDGAVYTIGARRYTGTKNRFAFKLDSSSGATLWASIVPVNTTSNDFAIAARSTGVFFSGLSLGNWGTPARSFNGSSDIVFGVLNTLDGSLLWHTFIGGTGYDAGVTMTIDSAGDIYIGGFSTGGIPGTPVRQYSWKVDAVVLKVSGTTRSVVWFTYLGGAGNDEVRDIYADGYGNVYVVGISEDSWGQPRKSHNFTDNTVVFAAKIDAYTGRVEWSTFLGADGVDNHGTSVGADSMGNVYVGGASPQYWGTPVVNHTDDSNENSFIAKLDLNGYLLWSTFLGTSSSLGGRIGVVDTKIVVAGTSPSGWGPGATNFSDALDAMLAYVSQDVCSNSNAPPELNEALSGFAYVNGVLTLTLAISSPVVANRSALSFSQGSCATLSATKNNQDTCTEVYTLVHTWQDLRDCGVVLDLQHTTSTYTAYKGLLRISYTESAGFLHNNPVSRKVVNEISYYMVFPDHVTASLNVVDVYAPPDIQAQIVNVTVAAEDASILVYLEVDVQNPFELTMLSASTTSTNIRNITVDTTPIYAQTIANVFSQTWVAMVVVNENVCQLGPSDHLIFSLTVFCQTGTVNCPFTTPEPVYLEFAVVTSDFCPKIGANVSVTASLASFTDETYSKQTVAYFLGREAFFKARLVADLTPESVSISKVIVSGTAVKAGTMDISYKIAREDMSNVTAPSFSFYLTDDIFFADTDSFNYMDVSAEFAMVFNKNKRSAVTVTRESQSNVQAMTTVALTAKDDDTSHVIDGASSMSSSVLAMVCALAFLILGQL